MKKTIWCCLLVAPFYSFAQNIDLKDISQVLHAKNVDSIDQYLQQNGFAQSRVTLEANKQQLVPVNTWAFRPGTNPDLTPPTLLHKSIDSANAGVQLETSNPWFYAHLMNQLPGLGFEYQQTLVTDNNAVLHFSNGREELTISISNKLQQQGFRFTLKTINDASVFNTTAGPSTGPARRKLIIQ
ncbi:MAG TPA: hypothetical protein VM187_17195 [Niastella sp.]|nr:hypothetical protein [Niastella sp.]